MIALVLHIVAIVLLVLAAVNVTVPRVSLGWIGLACWCLSEIIVRF